MSMTLALHIFAKAQDEAQLKRVLAATLGDKRDLFEVTSQERYWKNPALYDVTLSTPLKATTPGDAMFEALQVLYIIGSHWNIRTPHVFPGDRFEFHGDAEKPRARVFALESLSFAVTSY
jgi:hypothetical protein